MNNKDELVKFNVIADSCVLIKILKENADHYTYEDIDEIIDCIKSEIARKLNIHESYINLIITDTIRTELNNTKYKKIYKKLTEKLYVPRNYDANQLNRRVNKLLELESEASQEHKNKRLEVCSTKVNGLSINSLNKKLEKREFVSSKGVKFYPPELMDLKILAEASLSNTEIIISDDKDFTHFFDFYYRKLKLIIFDFSTTDNNSKQEEILDELLDRKLSGDEKKFIKKEISIREDQLKVNDDKLQLLNKSDGSIYKERLNIREKLKTEINILEEKLMRI